MNEVEKMYENANIKICKRKQGFTLKDCTDRDCRECGYYDMPPFTAEKQIELIRWLSEQYTITIRYMTSAWFITAETSDVTRTVIKFTVTANTFEEAIASAINHIWFWQDLTDAERKQTKNILESEVRE